MKNHRHTEGFTLVELAIVIAIIGMLIGGVIAGQTLLKNSDLQNTMTKLGRYRAAYTQFVTRYDAIPGDYLEATKNWGTDPNGCPTNSTLTPKKETCDGDGNGVLSDDESFRAWQQLADAELVEGTFTGLAGSGGSAQAVIGDNVPAGSLSGTGFSFRSTGAMSGNANYYDMASGVEIYFGKAATNSYTYSPALSPRQQRNIDDKLDDANPVTGRIRALKSPLNPSCTSADTAAATYALTNNGPYCTLLFIME